MPEWAGVKKKLTRWTHWCIQHDTVIGTVDTGHAVENPNILSPNALTHLEIQTFLCFLTWVCFLWILYIDDNQVVITFTSSLLFSWRSLVSRGLFLRNMSTPHFPGDILWVLPLSKLKFYFLHMVKTLFFFSLHSI